MDGERFDRWAKSLARRASRRVAIRRFTAGAAAGFLAIGRGRAGAQFGSVPLGGACFDTDQCDPFAVCADNGVAYDGPFNCCVTYGDRCWADEHCCGSLFCLGGACSVPYEGFGPGGGAGSLGLGEPCGDPAQCYSGSGTEATCADNGIDFGGVCCTFYGFGCGSDRHCCGSLLCLGGVCDVPYEV